MAVFKHEMLKLLPNNQDAMRMRENCYHWAEFFEKQKIPVPRLEGKAVVWGHCHQKATGGMSPAMKLLKEQMGLDAEEAKGGCCGLAGSWGFETGKYDISMQCGEIGFLPAVRRAAPSTVVIADGFSCKTQLDESKLGRHALHTGEVMRIAQKLASGHTRAQYPERLREQKPQPSPGDRAIRAGILVGLFGAAFAGYKALSKAMR